MDPDSTYQLIIEAIASHRWEEACEHAESLKDWLASGGFPPTSPNYVAILEYCDRL